MLKRPGDCGKIQVQDGYMICPKCGRNRHMMRVAPTTQAQDLVVYCRTCKTEHIVNIEKGQCYQSQSQ